MMGLVKIAVAIALEDHIETSEKSLSIAAATVLCNRIPDLFDYICDDKLIDSYTVETIRRTPSVLKTIYGYFDRYGCFSGELAEKTSIDDKEIYDDLFVGLKKDDRIYIIESHI